MKKFGNTENKRYETKCGNVVWVSRSMAVCVLLLRVNPEDESELQVLGTLRGKSLYQPDKWCLPCGYLDWDETLQQAAKRELFEETGIEIDEREFELYQIDSDPSKELQNITAHFIVYDLDRKDNPSVINDEIQESKWISINNASSYDWAFDHGERIKTIISNA